jgi:hypothetical protein
VNGTDVGKFRQRGEQVYVDADKVKESNKAF